MPFANKGSIGQTMLKLVAMLGFTIATSSADPSIKKITKVL